eukprot:CAMPEP_0184866372 /NCGR_PEP_ID=MMETSP0580-20130426/22117_1 /TAXON_ID=1118495 /ORGANISM="Dactyliosolen fragilissimus" /LENGTH=314 /DNA_ID=CAMNT_0027366043 /DNA_START=360 /DNA_END=1304 /DNA_ORIENTATION=+
MSHEALKGDEIVYDLIFLEFSINGFPGAEFLLARLKKRYPDAIIVYVHLQSLVSPTRLELTEIFFSQLMKPHDGLYYMFPIEQLNDAKAAELFADDRHHLSHIGHKFVAHGLSALLQTFLNAKNNLIPRKPRLGTWGAGDQCYMWLSSEGKFPISVQADGGKYCMFDEKKHKYSYEVEYGNDATLSFRRKDFNFDMKQINIPIHVVQMTKGNPPDYPKTEINLNYNNAEYKSKYVIDPREDPLFPEWSWAHLTSPQNVGFTTPGLNTLSIQPLEKTKEPFRIVGIIICGACVEMNQTSFHLLHRVNNIRLRIPQ